jgi:hypothetical protein
MAVGISEDARVVGGRPDSKHLRRGKLAAALAVATLVGIGSYASTYHVLSLLSTPSAIASGPVTPAGEGSGPHTVLDPGPATPTHPPR